MQPEGKEAARRARQEADVCKTESRVAHSARLCLCLLHSRARARAESKGTTHAAFEEPRADVSHHGVALFCSDVCAPQRVAAHMYTVSVNPAFFRNYMRVFARISAPPTEDVIQIEKRANTRVRVFSACRFCISRGDDVCMNEWLVAFSLIIRIIKYPQLELY